MTSRLLRYSSSNPYLNLALEHSILYYAPEFDFPMTVRLWENSNSIIVGRIQDVEKEVNIPFCTRNRVPIIRRISGGGTVFLGYGNLNVSFFLSKARLGENVDIITASERFTDLLIDTLKYLGYSDLEREGHSNILFQKQKISGAAGYFRKGWYLHHATLLFAMDLDMLNQSILARERDPIDTKRSRFFETTNIPDFDKAVWEEVLITELGKVYNQPFEEMAITELELRYGQKLSRNLYCTDTWNLQGKRKLIHPDD